MGFLNKDKLLDLTKRGLAYTGKKTWEAGKAAAKYTYDHREEIKGATIGAAKGAINTGKGIYGYTITKDKVQEQIDILTKQSARYQQLINQLKIKNKNKDKKQILFDSLLTSSAIGIEYYNVNVIPADIEYAYKLAYPNLAQDYTLTEIINQAGPEQVEGYVNGIKGKLFEIRYADYLNDSGMLPDGYTAILASSANNPGWDIAIGDRYGNIHDVLQLKATDQLDYVRSALERYPDIDVVTTSEVYNQIAMNEMVSDVISSNISNAELTDTVVDVFNDNTFEFDWCPSIVPFLIIGYSVSRKKNLTGIQRGKEFGGRAFSSYISYLAGGAITGLTGGFWLAGIAAAMAANVGLETGRAKYNYYSSLKNSIKENEKILRRLNYKLTYL